MKSKETFNGRKLAVSLSTYKILGFYQLIDPNGPKILGYHFYSTVLKIFLAIVQCISVFAVLGFFIGTGEIDSGHEKSNWFEIIIILSNCTLSSLKLYTLVSNADTIWKLFKITCIDYLQCVERNKSITSKLTKRCARSTIITSFIARSFLIVLFVWSMTPFVSNEEFSENSNATCYRYQNIINIKFPVTINNYNRFYFVFYLMELSVGFCIVYGSILIDAFLMSFCWIISAQYQSVTFAFQIFGHDMETSNGE